jgi:LysR family transcriptional regulator for bpeEF and oprC
VAARGNLTVWSGDALREAAVAGIGIAYSTRWLFRKDLENGSLVQILDRYQVAGPPHLVYYPPNPHLALRVRAFIDFLVEITRNRPA